jgi:3-isopropylmalate dehydrogenase
VRVPVSPSPPTRREPLTGALPGWDGAVAGGRGSVVGVLPGEGVGPEVVRAALGVLGAVAEATGRRFEVRVGGDIGLGARRAGGRELTPEVEAFCEAVFADGGAVLCGPGGGRFVYDLRARFDLYCKLTPIQPLPSLEDAGVLRERATAGVDLVIVRENRGGLYFGAHQLDRARGVARHALEYRASEVARILDAAARIARGRTGRLAVVVKAGGLPSLSALWCEEAERRAAEHGVALETLDVDNAAYQLVAAPANLDVIVAPNLFGDVLSDLGGLLLRSRGMSHSGNFGAGRRAVYQTGHGAAQGLAGTDRANPLGQIRSLAMMLEESFGLADESRGIGAAIDGVLGAGVRTADIACAGAAPVGTAEMGARVAEAVRRELTGARLSA